MVTAGIIGTLVLICSLIIAANNLFGLKDRFVAYLRRKLEVPTASEKLRARHEQGDRNLIHQIRSTLSTNVLEILREHNFGDAFRDEFTNPLHRYKWECEQPEFEFNDPELEEIRTRLDRAIYQFVSTAALNTWYADDDSTFRRVPKEWQWEQPDRWRDVVQTLNNSADEIVEAYDDLIQTGKRKLGLLPFEVR